MIEIANTNKDFYAALIRDTPVVIAGPEIDRDELTGYDWNKLVERTRTRFLGNGHFVGMCPLNAYGQFGRGSPFKYGRECDVEGTYVLPIVDLEGSDWISLHHIKGCENPQDLAKLYQKVWEDSIPDREELAKAIADRFCPVYLKVRGSKVTMTDGALLASQDSRPYFSEFVNYLHGFWQGHEKDFAKRQGLAIRENAAGGVKRIIYKDPERLTELEHEINTHIGRWAEDNHSLKRHSWKNWKNGTGANQRAIGEIAQRVLDLDSFENLYADLEGKLKHPDPKDSTLIVGPSSHYDYRKWFVRGQEILNSI